MITFLALPKVHYRRIIWKLTHCKQNKINCTFKDHVNQHTMCLWADPGRNLIIFLSTTWLPHDRLLSLARGQPPPLDDSHSHSNSSRPNCQWEPTKELGYLSPDEHLKEFELRTFQFDNNILHHWAPFP